MPETHFGTNPVRWKPNGGSVLHSLDNVYNDVETLKAGAAALPDFDAITSSNKFCITNTANGGTISYVTPTTSNFNEGTNLYYTDDRVAARVGTALQGGEIAHIVTQQLQAQTLVANSDIRLKENISKVEEEGCVAGLEPVQYHFRSDATKRTRYGFIAQDVEAVRPELVHTSGDGIKGISYQDIISLLVKDNQDLRKLLEALRAQVDVLAKQLNAQH
jgi:hypothetical protein